MIQYDVTHRENNLKINSEHEGHGYNPKYTRNDSMISPNKADLTFIDKKKDRTKYNNFSKEQPNESNDKIVIIPNGSISHLETTPDKGDEQTNQVDKIVVISNGNIPHPENTYDKGDLQNNRDDKIMLIPNGTRSDPETKSENGDKQTNQDDKVVIVPNGTIPHPETATDKGGEQTNQDDKIVIIPNGTIPHSANTSDKGGDEQTNQDGETVVIPNESIPHPDTTPNESNSGIKESGKRKSSMLGPNEKTSQQHSCGLHTVPSLPGGTYEEMKKLPYLANEKVPAIREVDESEEPRYEPPGQPHEDINTRYSESNILTNKNIGNQRTSRKEIKFPLDIGGSIRRHTSPIISSPRVSIEEPSSRKYSIDFFLSEHAGSKFSHPFKHLKSPDKRRSSKQTPDPTTSEISRMRNSVVAQKSLRKRKNTLDDDVLFGNKISEGHENFVLAYNMLTGIRVAVSRCSGIMKKLNANDFRKTKKLSFNIDGSELTPSSKYDFKFKDYCPEVFRELRFLFGIDPADYLISVTGKYILSELGSPGKSGSIFYFSRDYRFIIKTIHHSEHKQLRRILRDYYEHVKQFPNTLISQFYGLHRVKMPFSKKGTRKVHFLVMNNLFPPHRKIHLKYDLKGSTYGRNFQVPTSLMGDLSTHTLKDLNWVERGEKLKFGPEKKKLFFEQLQADVKLLEKVNVMDYSLLLGIHDCKKGNNTDSRKLSIFDPKSNDKFDLIHTNPRDIDLASEIPPHLYPDRMNYIFYGHDGGIRATDRNDNPLPEIYYLGIIDCLTNYSLRKRLETIWRSIGRSRGSISAVPSKEYGDRFIAFVRNGTTSPRNT